MNCDCEHCIEIRKQYIRAKKMYDALYKKNENIKIYL